MGRQLALSPSDLRARELVRRKFLERSRGATWELLLAFRGSTLRDLATSVIFWANLAEFIVVRVLSHTNYVQRWPSINLSLISIIGTFMSFFVTYYLGQCYAR